MIDKKEIRRILDSAFEEFDPEKTMSKDEVLSYAINAEMELEKAGYSKKDPEVKELIKEKLFQMLAEFEQRGLI